jgi:hypothetical protein
MLTGRRPNSDRWWLGHPFLLAAFQRADLLRWFIPRRGGGPVRGFPRGFSIEVLRGQVFHRLRRRPA